MSSSSRQKKRKTREKQEDDEAEYKPKQDSDYDSSEENQQQQYQDFNEALAEAFHKTEDEPEDILEDVRTGDNYMLNHPVSDLYITNGTTVSEALGAETEVITGKDALPRSIVKHKLLRKVRRQRCNFIVPNEFVPPSEDRFEMSDRCKICVMACSGMLFSNSPTTSDSLTTGAGLLDAMLRKYYELGALIGRSERFIQLANFWNDIVMRNMKTTKKSKLDDRLEKFTTELSTVTRIPRYGSPHHAAPQPESQYHITDADVEYHFEKCRAYEPDRQNEQNAHSLQHLRNNLERHLIYTKSVPKYQGDDASSSGPLENAVAHPGVDFDHARLFLATIGYQMKVNAQRMNMQTKMWSESSYSALAAQQKRLEDQKSGHKN